MSNLGGRVQTSLTEGSVDWTGYPETDSMISTIKFFKKQRSCLSFLRRAFNKKRLIFKEAVNPVSIIDFNLWMANMVSSEVRVISDKVQEMPADELQPATILFVASEVNFILPDLYYSLQLTIKNVTSGFFLKAALGPENNLLENILIILRWSVFQM